MRTLGSPRRYFHVLETGSASLVGSARIAAFMHLPEILREAGIDVRDVIQEAGVPPDVFGDPDNRVPYPDVGRLLSVSGRRMHCDHVGLLVGQRSRLTNMGLAGQIAFCADTAGEGLRNFADYFTLHNTAATVSVISYSGFSRFVYAITEPAMGDTGQLQLGAMAVGYNILQDLCGPGWQPTVVTVASSAPANLRPCHKFFRAPLRFDNPETALVFESHWLDQPLPPVDPRRRRQIKAAVRARLVAVLDDFPATVRRILRRQLLTDECSMDGVAALLGMHRRTLDRRLKRHGVLYGDVVESVKSEVACQLLRDTHLQMQQVAETLRYSSAANFSTAFRRWTGVTPSAYRRQVR